MAQESEEFITSLDDLIEEIEGGPLKSCYPCTLRLHALCDEVTPPIPEIAREMLRRSEDHLRLLMEDFAQNLQCEFHEQQIKFDASVSLMYKQFAGCLADPVQPRAVSTVRHHSVFAKEVRKESSTISHTAAFDEMTQRKQMMVNQFNYLEKINKSQSYIRTTNKKIFSSYSQSMGSFASLQQRFKRCTDSAPFSVLVTLVICANTILVGLQSDYDVRLALSKHSVGPSTTSARDFVHTQILWYCEVFLTVTFCVELVLRIVACGCDFWIGVHWKGNLFDAAITLGAIADLAVIGFNVSFGRLLRLLRLFSSMHTFRNATIAIKLRTMIVAITSSLPSLVFASFLLCLTSFVFACVIVQGAAVSLETSVVEEDVVQFVDQHLNSVPRAVLVLWASVTGGLSWLELENVLLRMHWVLGLVFVVYVCVMLLALLNIVTGIFVNESIETARTDRDIQKQRRDMEDAKKLETLKHIFFELDTDGSETLDLQEFREYLHNENVRSLFWALGVEPRDAIGCFETLDLDDSRKLDIHEFVMGCMSLLGAAKTIDLATVMKENKRMLRRIRAVDGKLVEQLQNVERAIHQLQSQRLREK